MIWGQRIAGPGFVGWSQEGRRVLLCVCAGGVVWSVAILRDCDRLEGRVGQLGVSKSAKAGKEGEGSGWRCYPPPVSLESCKYFCELILKYEWSSATRRRIHSPRSWYRDLPILRHSRQAFATVEHLFFLSSHAPLLPPAQPLRTPQACPGSAELGLAVPLLLRFYRFIFITTHEH